MNLFFSLDVSSILALRMVSLLIDLSRATESHSLRLDQQGPLQTFENFVRLDECLAQLLQTPSDS